MFLGSRHGVTERCVRRIRLRGGREIDRRFRQCQLSFGTAEKVVGILCRQGDAERAGIRESDVFTRHAHEAPREVERILTTREHAREPVERAIDIGATHRFVECGDEIVVLLAGFVVDW